MSNARIHGLLQRWCWWVLLVHSSSDGVGGGLSARLYILRFEHPVATWSVAMCIVCNQTVLHHKSYLNHDMSDQARRSSTFLQLRNHAIDIQRGTASRLRPEFLKRGLVFSFEGLFASPVHHATLDPHLNALSYCEVCALRNEQGGDLRVACTKDLVEEWLWSKTSACHQLEAQT